MRVVTVDEGTERIDLLRVQQDIEFDQIALLEADRVIVETRITAGDGFQLIEEIEHHFTERKLEAQFHAVRGEVVLADEIAPLLDAKGHDGPGILRFGDDLRLDVRLLDLVDVHHLGQLRRVVHVDDIAIGLGDDVTHVGHGRDDRHVELALQALLDYLHMQQAEKTATETEAERGTALWRPC